MSWKDSHTSDKARQLTPLAGARIQVWGRGEYYSGSLLFSADTGEDGHYVLGPPWGSIPSSVVLVEKKGYVLRSRLYPEEAKVVGEYEYRIDVALPRLGTESD